MKHPHSQLIKQWLEDTTQEIELKTVDDNSKVHWLLTTIHSVMNNNNDEYTYRIKPKHDEYEHFKQAIKDGKKVEYLDIDNVWKLKNGELHFNLPVEKYRIHDPYRELKEAQASGKRVVFQMSNGDYVDINNEEIVESFAPERYKIVDKDKIHIENINSPDGLIKVKITKSGITGKITAEVVDN
jgi:hypothetical protein